MGLRKKKTVNVHINNSTGRNEISGNFILVVRCGTLFLGTEQKIIKKLFVHTAVTSPKRFVHHAESYRKGVITVGITELFGSVMFL